MNTIKIIKLVMIIVGIVSVVFIVGWVSILLYSPTAYVSDVYVKETFVTEDTITFVGGFTGSARHYKGYKLEYDKEEHVLYLKIRHGLKPLISSKRHGFNITVSNKYGELKKIYLKDHTSENKILLWEK